jgi:hypothetical protein
MANKYYYGNGYTSTNSIAIIWSIEDVKQQLESLNENYGIDLELSDENCMEVLQRVVDNHDSEYGVNWDSLYNAIEYCFEDEIREKRKEDGDE